MHGPHRIAGPSSCPRTESVVQISISGNPKPKKAPRRLPRLRMALVADAWALLGRSCLLARYSIAFILPTPNACRRGLVRSVRVRVHGRRRSRDPRTRTSHGLGLVRVRVWHCCKVLSGLWPFKPPQNAGLFQLFNCKSHLAHGGLYPLIVALAGGGRH